MKSPYTVIEEALVSKTGREEECEDALYLGDAFVAAIDGATAKSSREWGGVSRGRSAAEVLKGALDSLRGDADAFEAADCFTEAVQEFHRRFDAEEMVRERPVERITASIVVLSMARREIWLIGDCQARIGEHWIRNDKEIDTLIAGARVAFLEASLAAGADIEDLQKDDPGREFILPLLARQAALQNRPEAGPLWFPVIDGTPVPREGVRVESVPPATDTVVLATDGYPVLCGTLDESEKELERILQADPLLIREFRATKTTRSPDHGFDDRAYLRIRLVT